MSAARNLRAMKRIHHDYDELRVDGDFHRFFGLLPSLASSEDFAEADVATELFKTLRAHGALSGFLEKFA